MTLGLNSVGAQQKKLHKLQEILLSSDLFAINYESGETKTAVETFESRSGNCMSMTNLFIAMARHAGLDAHYHLVKATPEWDQSGNTLIETQHINATGILRNGGRYIFDFFPELRVQEKMKTVTDQYALAIYHNNLAAETLIDESYELSLRHLRLSLELEPTMADAWNNMGATQRRLQHTDLARASFQQAITLDRFNNAAMSNLSRIYFNENNTERGNFFAKRVAKHRSRNPYYRYSQARSAITEKNYELAVDELNAAIKLKDDEAVFFDALAQAYIGLEDEQKQLMSEILARRIRESANEQDRSSLEIHRPGNVILRY